MHVVLSALAGALAGPLIHHLAVQAGSDLGFAWSDARCRRCAAPIGISQHCAECGLGAGRTLATSLVTALLFGLTAWSFGPVWVLVAYLFFAGMTVALFLTDIDHKRIPNRITYPATPAAALLLASTAVLDGVPGMIPRALLGAVVYAGFFGVVFLVASGGFGFGDVKLAVSLGMFATFLGWDRLFLSGMATAGIGGVVALVALLAGRAGARTEIPYGPPMIAGTWAAILAGPWLAELLL